MDGQINVPSCTHRSRYVCREQAYNGLDAIRTLSSLGHNTGVDVRYLIWSIIQRDYTITEVAKIRLCLDDAREDHTQYTRHKDPLQ